MTSIFCEQRVNESHGQLIFFDLQDKEREQLQAALDEQQRKEKMDKERKVEELRRKEESHRDKMAAEQQQRKERNDKDKVVVEQKEEKENVSESSEGEDMFNDTPQEIRPLKTVGLASNPRSKVQVTPLSEKNKVCTSFGGR